MLNIPELLQRLIMFSRNVFCGATSPRLTTGMPIEPNSLHIDTVIFDIVSSSNGFSTAQFHKI